MAGPLQWRLRHPRPAGVLRWVPFILLLCAAAGAAAAATGAGPPSRPWAFGWDPGESGEGLTVRYEVRPGWDVSVAAGPNDFRYEETSTHWSTVEDAVDDGTPTDSDDRQEQGWVRLTVGGRCWRDGRFAVHGTGAVTYRWSAEEYRQRDERIYDDAITDWYNVRDHTDRDSWWVTLGLRPSVAVTERFLVEFESGVRLRFETFDRVRETWWDEHPGTARTETSNHGRLFQSYGRFDLYSLRFIFRF